MSIALVLSGGGARAAFQVGVLAAIADICAELKITHPFQYYTGLSAGAINVSMLASTDQNHIRDGCNNLIRLWSHVESHDVYISDPLTLSLGGLQWIRDLSFGGLKKQTPSKSLLNNQPLYSLISQNCIFENIQKNIEAKKFKAVAISALDYSSATTTTFIQGDGDIPQWQRARKQSEKSLLQAEHVLASSAIPLLFSPVPIGQRYFGDGCIRNNTPCGPAISMGADKLLAIGVRKRQDTCYLGVPVQGTQPPSVGRVVNVLMHALMMDGLEVDIERMERINSEISKLSERERKNLDVRPVEYLWISPSREISQIAEEKVKLLPGMVRYLLQGLGSLKDTCELASYLLFDPRFCAELLELGYEDAMKEKENIQRFLQP